MPRMFDSSPEELALAPSDVSVVQTILVAITFAATALLTMLWLSAFIMQDVLLAQLWLLGVIPSGVFALITALVTGLRRSSNAQPRSRNSYLRFALLCVGIL